VTLEKDLKVQRSSIRGSLTTGTLSFLLDLQGRLYLYGHVEGESSYFLTVTWLRTFSVQMS